MENRKTVHFFFFSIILLISPQNNGSTEDPFLSIRSSQDGLYPLESTPGFTDDLLTRYPDDDFLGYQDNSQNYSVTSTPNPSDVLLNPNTPKHVTPGPAPGAPSSSFTKPKPEPSNQQRERAVSFALDVDTADQKAAPGVKEAKKELGGEEPKDIRTVPTANPEVKPQSFEPQISYTINERETPAQPPESVEPAHPQIDEESSLVQASTPPESVEPIDAESSLVQASTPPESIEPAFNVGVPSTEVFPHSQSRIEVVMGPLPPYEVDIEPPPRPFSPDPPATSKSTLFIEPYKPPKQMYVKSPVPPVQTPVKASHLRELGPVPKETVTSGPLASSVSPLDRIRFKPGRSFDIPIDYSQTPEEPLEVFQPLVKEKEEIGKEKKKENAKKEKAKKKARKEEQVIEKEQLKQPYERFSEFDRNTSPEPLDVNPSPGPKNLHVIHAEFVIDTSPDLVDLDASYHEYEAQDTSFVTFTDLPKFADASDPTIVESEAMSKPDIVPIPSCAVGNDSGRSASLESEDLEMAEMEAEIAREMEELLKEQKELEEIDQMMVELEEAEELVRQLEKEEKALAQEVGWREWGNQIVSLLHFTSN